MRELLKRLSELEPARFTFHDSERDAWSLTYKPKPGMAFEIVSKFDDEPAEWCMMAPLMTFALLEEMGHYTIISESVSSWQDGLWFKGECYKGETLHEMVLKAYLAYRELAATSGGGE